MANGGKPVVAIRVTTSVMAVEETFVAVNGVITTVACLWPNGGMSEVEAVKCVEVSN